MVSGFWTQCASLDRFYQGFGRSIILVWKPWNLLDQYLHIFTHTGTHKLSCHTYELIDDAAVMSANKLWCGVCCLSLRCDSHTLRWERFILMSSEFMVTHFSAAHLTLNGTQVLSTKDRKKSEELKDEFKRIKQKAGQCIYSCKLYCKMMASSFINSNVKGIEKKNSLLTQCHADTLYTKVQIGNIG